MFVGRTKYRFVGATLGASLDSGADRQRGGAGTYTSARLVKKRAAISIIRPGQDGPPGHTFRQGGLDAPLPCSALLMRDDHFAS
eukprot:scaffold49482_cov106-Phaeocystis_antarctica.AAC.2